MPVGGLARSDEQGPAGRASDSVAGGWAGAGALALVTAIAFGASALALVIAIPLQATGDSVLTRVEAASQALGFTILAVTGAVLLHRRPRQLLGWLLTGAGVAQLTTMTVTGSALLAVRSGGPLSDPVLWATNWMWVPAQVGVLLVLLRFPSGRLPGRRWRVIEVVVLAWGVACVATTAVLPGPVGLTVLEHLQNPYGWTAAGPVLHALLSPLFLLLPLLTVASAAAPVLRWRRAGGHARQQLRWVAAAAALTVVAAPLVLLGTDSAAAPLSLATLLLPTAIAVAVLRRRLWEVGVIARTALSGAVTAGLLLTAYAAAVRWVPSPWVPGVAGLAAATLAIPGHRSVCRLLDRFLFGVNGDPARIARQLRSQQNTGPLDTLRETTARLARALRLPWVAFRDADGAILAQAGTRGSAETRVSGVPVQTGGHVVGVLLAEERSPGEGLSPRDTAVLGEVAEAAALVLRAVRSDAQVAASLERLRTVRREERARLQRDLHDGLGPVLGGVTMHAEAARNLLAAGADPQRVVAQLEAIGADAAEAVSEIRRLIDELRPSALGEAGLAEAVQQACPIVAPGLTCTIDIDLPALPDSGTEVAAYRIVIEAVRNAARHAEARQVRVAAHVEAGWLVLGIRDDGRGLAGSTPGVGIRAMTERAAELGGTLSVSDRPPCGTEVVARLPLGDTDE